MWLGDGGMGSGLKSALGPPASPGGDDGMATGRGIRVGGTGR